MLCLAIDTAGPYCSAALFGDNGALASESERVGRGHAERLMPMIDGLLARSAAAYRDISRIGVTTGPGSFTGVRIGISTARGLALALDVEAFGIGVMDVMIEQASRLPGVAAATIFVAVLPAARSDIFVQAARMSEDRTGSPDILLPATKMSVEEALGWIDGRNGSICLFGSGAAAIGRDELLLCGPAAAADHADIGLLAEMARRGAGTSPPRPLYLRAPDARPQAGKAVERA